MEEKYSVLIIGAGPAGLATAAALKARGIGSIVLEKSDVAGGSYMKLHPSMPLVSPRRYLDLPFSPISAKKEILSVGEFRDYLRDYVQRSDPDIRFGKTVKRVSFTDSSVKAECADGSIFEGAHLVVCTGMMTFPKPFPFRPGDNPGVRFEYASQWKGADAYRGKKVLVVGSGTSASEIATFLAPVAETWLHTRGELKTVKLNIGSVNVHHLFRWIEFLPKAFFPKVCGGRWKEPALDFGLIDAIRSEKIKHKKGELRFEKGSARFSDGTVFVPEVVISCTGYEFRSDYLPAEVRRTPQGAIEAVGNRSRSHDRLFVVGHPCSGAIDSKFIRGIRRDSLRVAARIGRSK